MKLSWKGYWKPTPKGIRKLADSILAGATLASTFTFVYDYKKLSIVILIVSVVAKIFSNFLTDDTTTPDS
jgi:hypothetical protein